MRLTVIIALAIILAVCSVIRKRCSYLPFAVLTVIFFYFFQEAVMPWAQFTNEGRNEIIIAYTIEILSLFLLCVSILYIFLLNKKRGFSSFAPLALNIGMIITRIMRYWKVDHAVNDIDFTTNEVMEQLFQLQVLQAKYTRVFFWILTIIFGFYFWQLFCCKKQPIEVSST